MALILERPWTQQPAGASAFAHPQAEGIVPQMGMAGGLPYGRQLTSGGSGGFATSRVGGESAWLAPSEYGQLRSIIHTLRVPIAAGRARTLVCRLWLDVISAGNWSALVGLHAGSSNLLAIGLTPAGALRLFGSAGAVDTSAVQPTGKWLNIVAAYDGTTTWLVSSHDPSDMQSSTALTGGPTATSLSIGGDLLGAYTHGGMACSLAYILPICLSPAQMLQLVFRPWLVFAPRRIIVPHATAAGYTHPTLSNARMGSLTSTGGVPLLDYAF